MANQKKVNSDDGSQAFPLQAAENLIAYLRNSDKSDWRGAVGDCNQLFQYVLNTFVIADAQPNADHMKSMQMGFTFGSQSNMADQLEAACNQCKQSPTSDSPGQHKMNKLNVPTWLMPLVLQILQELLLHAPLAA